MVLGLHDTEYFRMLNYGNGHIGYFANYPMVLALLWTVGVWGGLASSILLLLRTRWARPVAFIAFVCQLFLIIVTLAFMDRWRVFGPWQSLFDGAILLLTGAFVCYCRTMAARGVLR
jgi:hypothetical protein